jgi:L-fuconolactonase
LKSRSAVRTQEVGNHVEPIIDPQLPIVDAHNHLWQLNESVFAWMRSQQSIRLDALEPVFRMNSRYLLDDYLEDARSGHNIRATVFVQAGPIYGGASYRTSGPESMRSVGEVEFAAGIAQQTYEGTIGPLKICAAIVGGAELCFGHDVADVLQVHMEAANGHYRGVRCVGWHDSQFRAGYSWLRKFDLSFDAYAETSELASLADLARSFPETRIVLNHAGLPAADLQKEAGRYEWWRQQIRELAGCDNVTVKLGGLGMTADFSSSKAERGFNSQQLAVQWAPYIETCIEAFGVNRCMFEGNFPCDAGCCTYRTLWNTYKQIAAGASRDEKEALFSGTAARVYRITI